MTEDTDLLDLHLAALFTQDEQGDLVATNDPEADRVAAPRLYLGRSPERSVLRFRRGMDQTIRAALRELAAPDLTPNDPNREPVNLTAMVDLLAAQQPVENIYFGPAFSFPDAGAVVSTFRHSGESRNPGAHESGHREVGAVREPPLQRSASVRSPLPQGEGEGEGDRGPGGGRLGPFPSPLMGEGEGEGDPEPGGGRSGPVPAPLMGKGEGEGDPEPGSGSSTGAAAPTEFGEPDPGLFRHSGEEPAPYSIRGRNPDPSTADIIEVSPSTTHLLSPEFAWLADELTVRTPVMAIVVNGMAVSVCFSARSTSDASEAGVETLPKHRGRRYAVAATLAWADAVRRQARTPLYSTSWTNQASRRVAARLHLTQYATDFHIT